MVSERDFGRTQLIRHAIQDTTAQTRTQPARGFALFNHAFDNAVGVLILDVKRHAKFGQVVRQNFSGKIRLFLIQINRDNFKMDGRALAQFEQNIEQAITVLTT